MMAVVYGASNSAGEDRDHGGEHSDQMVNHLLPGVDGVVLQFACRFECTITTSKWYMFATLMPKNSVSILNL